MEAFATMAMIEAYKIVKQQKLHIPPKDIRLICWEVQVCRGEDAREAQITTITFTDAGTGRTYKKFKNGNIRQLRSK